MNDRFTLDRLVSDAQTATGLDDLGAPTWQEGLDRLLPDFLGPAQLHDIGVEVVAADLQSYLTNRLQIVAWRKAHPEVAEVKVERPVVIVGQPRTGTTILYDLLAQDPRFRVPRSWEVDKPVPPAEPSTYLTDPRIAEAQAQYDLVDTLIPGFAAFHEVGAMLGQECVRITAGDFRSMIFPTQYHVPSYQRWLLTEADMAPAYDLHRRFLQLLQWDHPGERWLLKSPGHIWCLADLMAAYPGAMLVQTHRDPVRIIASIGSLVKLLRSLACDDPTIEEAATDFAEAILLGVERSLTARQQGIVTDPQVADVGFADFIADPLAAVAAVYAHFGLELTEEARAAMAGFLAANGREERGAHTYTFADTGLEAEPLRRRARPYQEAFGVPDEAL